jgi:multicomponent Na+:H+ antiporter subunit D
VPFLRGVVRQAYMLALPILGLPSLLLLDPGGHWHVPFLGYQLELVRVDRLANVFGIVFFLAAGLSALYALQDDDPVQQTAALIYAGSAVSAVYAGDLLTLFVFWELTAIASVFLIWARRTERAYRAGMRYLMVQVGSGVLPMAGALFHVAETGSLTFTTLGLDGNAGTSLIFLAFGIKCAFPFLHNWLQDAYPEATVGGTVCTGAWAHF